MIIISDIKIAQLNFPVKSFFQFPESFFAGVRRMRLRWWNAALISDDKSIITQWGRKIQALFCKLSTQKSRQRRASEAAERPLWQMGLVLICRILRRGYIRSAGPAYTAGPALESLAQSAADSASAAARMTAAAASMPIRLLTHRSYSRLWPQRPVAK